jgi:polysaccharide deacetylase 2 family uncharacterized protein YibQ
MDDFSTPLGQTKPAAAKPRLRLKLPFKPVYAVAIVLALFLTAFVAVAFFNNDPFGGEPSVKVAITPPPPGSEKTAKATELPKAPESAKTAAPAANERRITIIDGSSGKRQEVIVPDAKDAPSTAPSGGDRSLLEDTPYGALPVIGADGLKPAKAYAVAAAPAAANQPNIAIVVTGLGVGAAKTADAIMKLPRAVTLAFTPYGADPSAAVTRARQQGHEVLLQIPLEPYDYPDNDPGPQTLMVETAAEQNIGRLHTHMGRFQGYVGVANFMGARFSASEAALKPVMQDIAKRGLIYFDDGTAARSASRLAADAQAVPHAMADVSIDAVPSAAEIDKALARLEGLARQRGAAIGVASGLPASIERISAWARTLEGKGLVLVPLTAALPRAKSS